MLRRCSLQDKHRSLQASLPFDPTTLNSHNEDTGPTLTARLLLHQLGGRCCIRYTLNTPYNEPHVGSSMYYPGVVIFSDVRTTGVASRIPGQACSLFVCIAITATLSSCAGRVRACGLRGSSVGDHCPAPAWLAAVPRVPARLVAAR
jgi:hypothetical protein